MSENDLLKPSATISAIFSRLVGKVAETVEKPKWWTGLDVDATDWPKAPISHPQGCERL